MPYVQRALLAALLAGPAVALAVLAPKAGGYFPQQTALAALAALAACALWALLGARPLGGLSRAAALVALLLAAFAGWTLLSAGRSDARWRALVELDRTLLYLTVFALFAAIGRTGLRVRALVALLALASGAVAIAGLGAWLLPETVTIDPIFERRRMSWPTGYWNTTGLLAGLGAVWCLHLAAATREHVAVRAFGAAAVVPLVAVLGFTASRGAVGAALIGALVYVLVVRSPSVLIGLTACVPAAIVAAAIVRSAPALATTDLSPAVIEQGGDAALALAVAAAAVALLRVALVPVETRLARLRIGGPGRRWQLAGAAVACVAALAAGAALDAPDRARAAYDEFVDEARVGADQGGGRLLSFSASGRLDLWRVAWRQGVEPDPLKGSGAGTFAVLWDRGRPLPGDVLVAHSLYLGTLAELGVVGAALLLAALAVMLAALMRRARGSSAEAATWAALLAAAVGWAAFALVDWNWEMPACTIWLLAAAGMALSRPVGDGVEAPSERESLSAAPAPAPEAEAPMLSSAPPARPPWGPRALAARVAVVAAVAALALVPLALARSERPLAAAVAALQRGDCTAAQRSARSSLRVARSNPQPAMVLAYCAAREGRAAAAVSLAKRAVAADPDDWEPRYAFGLVLAAAGRDARPALAQAARRNPLDRYVRRAVAVAERPRSVAKRQAAGLPLPLAVRFCGGPTRASDLTACGDSVLPRLGGGGPVNTRRP